jgi:hypothetical protein
MRRRLSPAYFGEPLLNPTPFLFLLAALALGGEVTPLWGWMAGAGLGVKLAADGLLAGRLRGAPLPARAYAWIPVKDLLVFTLWLVATYRRTIVWRGHRMRIERGSLLVPAAPAGVLPPLTDEIAFDGALEEPAR